MARRIVSILSIAALVISWLAFGALAGATIVSRLMEPAPDGWSQIADALGGLMLGGVVGTMVAAGLAVWLRGRRLWLATGGAVLGVALLLVVLRTTEPRRASLDRSVEAPTAPSTPAPSTPAPSTPAPSTPVPSTTVAPPAAAAEAPAVGEADESPWLALEPIESRLPGCEENALRAVARWGGELSAGESFRQSFGPRLAFEILPDADRRGWSIRVVSEESDVPTLTALTPPLRGPSPLDLAAWHFLDADGDALNQGEVNAPQRLRLFTFSPEVPEILAREGSPTPEDLEVVGAVGRGALEVLALEMGEPRVAGDPRTASLERLEWSACLSWPRAMGD